MIYITLYVLVHLVCTFFVTGIGVAYFQTKYKLIKKEHYKTDLLLGIILGLCGGPLSLIVIFFHCNCTKYGLQWRYKE